MPHESAMTHDLVKVREGILHWREVDVEVVLLDVRDDMYLAVNHTGTVLWPMLMEGTTKDALVTALTDAYDIDQDRAGRDVDAFLEAMHARDMFEE